MAPEGPEQGQGQEQEQGEQAREQDQVPLSAVEAAGRAKQQLSELTGLTADTISSVSSQDGNWEVGVEMVELARLPPSTDVLGTYAVSLDGDGRLTGYERVQRYLRSQAQ